MEMQNVKHTSSHIEVSMQPDLSVAKAHLMQAFRPALRTGLEMEGEKHGIPHGKAIGGFALWVKPIDPSIGSRSAVFPLTPAGISQGVEWAAKMVEAVGPSKFYHKGGVVRLDWNTGDRRFKVNPKTGKKVERHAIHIDKSDILGVTAVWVDCDTENHFGAFDANRLRMADTSLPQPTIAVTTGTEPTLRRQYRWTLDRLWTDTEAIDRTLKAMGRTLGTDPSPQHTGAWLRVPGFNSPPGGKPGRVDELVVSEVIQQDPFGDDGAPVRITPEALQGAFPATESFERGDAAEIPFDALLKGMRRLKRDANTGERHPDLDRAVRALKRAAGNDPERLGQAVKAYMKANGLTAPLGEKMAEASFRLAEGGNTDDVRWLAHGDNPPPRVAELPTGEAPPIETIRQWLSLIDPDCDRKKWLSIVAAIKNAGSTPEWLDLADDWSAGELSHNHAGCPGYSKRDSQGDMGRAAVEKAWNSLDAHARSGRSSTWLTIAKAAWAAYETQPEAFDAEPISWRPSAEDEFEAVEERGSREKAEPGFEGVRSTDDTQPPPMIDQLAQMIEGNRFSPTNPADRKLVLGGLCGAHSNDKTKEGKAAKRHWLNFANGSAWPEDREGCLSQEAAERAWTEQVDWFEVFGETAEAVNTLTAEAHRRGFSLGLELPTLDELKRCVYVTTAEKYLRPNGLMISAKALNTVYATVTPMWEERGKRSRPSPEVYFKQVIQRVADFGKVDPDRAFLDIWREGNITYVNTYDPKKLGIPIEGDPSPFIDHIKKICPDDWELVLDWMAWCVQNPGKKPRWALVLQGTPGNGKDTIAKPMAKFFGARYQSVDPKQISNRFNGYMDGAFFVNVSDMMARMALGDWDRLKPMITNDAVQIEAKGVDQRTIEARAAFFFTTNHRDAFPKTESDRRLAIIFTAQQSTGDLQRDGLTGTHFRKLHRWLDREHGSEIVIGHLLKRKIRHSMGDRAPRTSTHDEVVQESRPAYERVVESFVSESCEIGDSFREGASTLWREFRAWCLPLGEDAATQTKFGKALGALGFRDEKDGVKFRLGLRLRLQPG